MDKQQQSPPIDNELFHIYVRYQLCQLKKSPRIWNDSKEKSVIMDILENCQHVNGNTLRSIFNDTFKNSIQNCDYGGSDQTSVTINNMNKQEPQPADAVMDEATSLIEVRKAETSIESNSAKQHERKPAIQMVTEAAFPALFDTPPALSRRNRSNTSPGQGILSRKAFDELDRLLDKVEQSKQTLYTRMRVINESFTISYAIPTKSSSSTNAFSFHILQRFSPNSIRGQCQENLVAYRFGNLIRTDRRVPVTKKGLKEKREYYNDLMATIKSTGLSRNMDFAEYSEYCERVVETAEKIGVYSIFIPEILSTSKIREVYIILQLRIIFRNTLSSISRQADMTLSRFETV
ncbi:hypothetical protein [Parasitella parasitica]|uniref:Uncharacterized protein n=1 Tax=Parasitella parasitica TaxID=35722 RepID=A0A0B7NXU5_9FUNG|nr:hypothetical protein [Parasitella parasitica]